MSTQPSAIAPNFDPNGVAPVRFTDANSERMLSAIHPAVATRARRLNAMALRQKPEIQVRITCGLRTWAEQAALFDKGRSTPGSPCVHNGLTRPVGTCTEHKLGLPVTNARPGQSWHNFGMAFDVAVGTPQHSPVFVADWNAGHPSWVLLIKLARAIGLTSGALWRSFPDCPHFELTGKLNMPGLPGAEVSDLYHDGGLAKVWRAAELT